MEIIYKIYIKIIKYIENNSDNYIETNRSWKQIEVGFDFVATAKKGGRG
jgi:hypothetical protein